MSDRPRGGVTAYAAHRKNLGKSGTTHGAIKKAIDAGRLSKSITWVKRGSGQAAEIDFLLADEEWDSNTDPTQAERTSTGLITPSVGGEDLFDKSSGGATKLGKEDPHGYLEHRARTEEYRSKQAELEYLKDLGLLVPAANAREANFRRYRMLRDKLLNIPDRVATIVAAERDPGRVHQQLTDEIKRVLSELSNDATAEAAGGPTERVAA